MTLLPPNERDVSMVFQSYALFPHMTVLENVSYGLADSALSKSQRLDKAHDGLRQVGLEGYDERLPSELSGGQQQRVACARALVLEPQVLLFDEPLSNLDAKLRRRMREEIRDLQQRLHLTSIYVTHDQEEALAVSDKIVVMNKGRIAQEGTPVDLYERPADSFVADFIGGANLIPCEIVRREDEAALVRFGNNELRVAAPRVDGRRGLPGGAFGRGGVDQGQWRGRPDRDGAQGDLSRRSLGIHARHGLRRAVPRAAGRQEVRARHDRRAAAGPAAPVGRGTNLEIGWAEFPADWGRDDRTQRQRGSSTHRHAPHRMARHLSLAHSRSIGRPPNPVQWASPGKARKLDPG